MIIYHEGLPRSGKSYEAVVKHVLPALESGRHVYARMDGFDDPLCIAKIAHTLSKPYEQIERYLHHLDESQVLQIYDVVKDNSLVLIDELQNFWPSGKGSLQGPISKFVTEHGHRGIDILAMGQDLRDCHPLWRRRVDRKIVFMKLDVLGAENKYKWVMFKAKSGEKFEQVATGVQSYDPKYFGTYKSHVADDINKENYKDSRSVIWNSASMRFGAAFIVVSVLLGGWYLQRQFDPETTSLYKAPVKVPVKVPEKDSRPGHDLNIVQSAYNPPVSSSAGSPPPAVKDYVQNLETAGGRIRLVTVMFGLDRPPYVVVEFRDSSYRVTDRLDNYMLADLGWSVEIKSIRMVRLHKKGFSEMIATAWPLEVVGEVSERQNEGVRRASKADESGGDRLPAPSGPPALESPPGSAPGPLVPPVQPGVIPQMVVNNSGGAAAIGWTAGRLPR